MLILKIDIRKKNYYFNIFINKNYFETQFTVWEHVANRVPQKFKKIFLLKINFFIFWIVWMH